ncbi:MAG: hypothetical protein H6744_18730 [Deltaproteobacteria bacterium]|nr:hypothetical protein [Deltaproteobacteria bacterium]MCB9788718.1 hypothetical protein [Deltaproteobacteria bacterium]
MIRAHVPPAFGRASTRALVAAATCGLVLAAQAARASGPERLPNGVELWMLPGPADGLVSVAVQLEGGLAAEASGTPGQAAALAALLTRGPSAGLATGELEHRAESAGLDLDIALGWRAVTLFVSGPEESLDTALWLALDRLRPPGGTEHAGEALAGALFLGAERSRRTAVGRFGAPEDMLVAALQGEERANSAFASRLLAGRLAPDTLESLAEDARSGAAVRVLIAAPEALIEDAARLARRDLGALARRPPPSPVTFEPAERPRVQPVAPLELPNPTDTATRLLLAWDLRGVAFALHLRPAARDAAMLTLRAWLDHAGSTPHERLTDDQASARDLHAALSDDPLPVLIAEIAVRGADVRDARSVLMSELERLGSSPPREAEVRGAADAAATELRQRFSFAPERARLADTLTQTGRVVDQAPGEWLESLLAALARIDAGDLAAYASWTFHPERLAEARVSPVGEGAAGPEVDADVLGTYLRIMVDLRCPPPGQTIDVVELLKLKYGMEARSYVLLTRAIAQRPSMMRQLTADAELRCEELTKLRSLMSRERALELHEAVSCGPARLPDGARRERELAAIFSRFGIDASWFGPLVGMLREDVAAARTMDAVEARCAPVQTP